MYIGNINSNFVKAMGSWPTLQISRSISGGEAVCSMTINNSGIIPVLESIKKEILVNTKARNCYLTSMILYYCTKLIP